jgi:hypothetical protein
MMQQVKISLTFVNRRGIKARQKEYPPEEWEIDRR